MAFMDVFLIYGAKIVKGERRTKYWNLFQLFFCPEPPPILSKDSERWAHRQMKMWFLIWPWWNRHHLRVIDNAGSEFLFPSSVLPVRRLCVSCRQAVHSLSASNVFFVERRCVFVWKHQVFSFLVWWPTCCVGGLSGLFSVYLVFLGNKSVYDTPCFCVIKHVFAWNMY